ncbi:MAG: flagella basal body P-ring formation protein FlgA [Pirellulaceae bacterium]
MTSKQMRKTLFCFVLFVASGAAAEGAEGAEGAEIRLRADAESAGPIVRLGDVAEIEGELAAQGSVLADIALFPVPAKGASRILRRQELRQLLALCDVDLKGCQFSGAESVVIQAAATHDRILIRPALHLIPASSHVRLVPKQPLAKPAAAEDEEELPPLVKRNSSVTVHARAAGVRITTSGKALAEGIHGESIPVELADSRERILARVIAPQVVEIRAPGAVAAAVAPAANLPAPTLPAPSN